METDGRHQNKNQTYKDQTNRHDYYHFQGRIFRLPGEPAETAGGPILEKRNDSAREKIESIRLPEIGLTWSRAT